MSVSGHYNDAYLEIFKHIEQTQGFMARCNVGIRSTVQFEIFTTPHSWSMCSRWCLGPVGAVVLYAIVCGYRNPSPKTDLGYFSHAYC